MKIRIGLVARSFGWEQLCNQEGISFILIDLRTQSIAEECSLLVVNKEIDTEEREQVEQYLRAGGAVFGYTRHLLGVAGIEGRWEELAYIVSDHDEVFPSVWLLDVGVRGFVARGANAMRTDSNTFAIAAGPLSGGFAVVMPFDIGALVQDKRPATKSFYSAYDRPPSERVSLVSKGELLHLVHDAFEYLHTIRGIAYVHLWYFPNDSRNLFTFRIDTDGASQQDIDALYKLGQTHHVSMSWFLDVKSHEQWLSHFRPFVDQEIGLHCYEHQTYTTFDANLNNMMKGVQEMKRVGLTPSGFTSPFGVWNQGLARAIDDAGFEYTSEFSFAYDTFPLVASADPVQFNTIQVPIHPVCIGSMLRIGYTDAQMSNYFSTAVTQKLTRSEPLFFYHHPSHRHWDVVGNLFQVVERLGIENMTLGTYARWWKRRIGLELSVNHSGENIDIKKAGASISSDIWIHVAHPERGEATLPITNSINLESVEWKAPAVQLTPPNDLRRMRDFDPRQMVGELYNRLIRKFK